MSIKTKPSYEELLKKIKEQGLEINRLSRKEKAITNFEFFLKESPDLICIADTQACFKEINSAFTKILGYSKNELLTNSFTKFIHPDDLEKTLNEVKNLSSGNPTIDFENRYLKKNGEFVYLQWKANLNSSNNLIYAIARDITEIRQTQRNLEDSEKSLNVAQKIAKTGSWEFDLTTNKLNWSNELYAIFEIENKPNPNLYKDYLTRFTTEDIENLQNMIMKSIIDKTPYEIEHRVILSNNRVKWVFGTGIPIVDEKGNVTAFRGLAQDITQKKEIAEAIKAKEHAEAANKAKSDFLANMSHEIRTPLNGIVGFSDLLMKTDLDKNQLEYMSTINESANTLMEIINDILDFSKIEAGKLELNIEEIDLFELTHQVIDLFTNQANLKNIDLILNIDKNVPQYIEADSIRLKQVLVNLLSNALKFTSFGQIRLDINQISAFDTNSSTVRFSVKDTGIGIKHYNQEKIFHSFIQEDNSTSRKYGGTGLGLTISNQLLKLMKSKLHLISKYGDGSDFSFSIKIKKVNSKKINTIGLNSLIKETINAKKENLEDLNILIVEDNKVNMFLAKTLVNRILPNAIIFEAYDGNEAVKYFKKQPLDFILMDIQMPIKNGYEATTEIRKLKGAEKIPIIALTAGIMVGEKEKCLEAGMSDYISKPIIQSDLEKIVLKWMKK